MTRQTSANDQVKVEAGKVDAFGERVAVAINRVGGSTKMAKIAGVSTSVLSKWRRNESDPSRTRLVKMARAAGVSVEWLATGEGEPQGDEQAPGEPAGGPSEEDLDLLEEVAAAAFSELQARDIRLVPAAQARLVRVLYRHFATKHERPDHDTISNIIDLAAYR